MDPLLQEYLALMQAELQEATFSPKKMDIRLFSSVMDLEIDDRASLAPKYWAANLTSPVLFHEAVSRLLNQEPNSLLLEIGPHSTLAGPLRQICAEAQKPFMYIPTMLRSKDCAETILSAIGQLYQRGANVAFEELIAVGNVLTDLPPYPWDHSTSFWHENRISKDWRLRPIGHHGILGQRIPEGTSLEPSWRVVLDIADEMWLYDHKIRDDIVFPFAGYVAMAGEAIRQITGIDSGYSVRHVIAHTALVLTESKPVEIVTTLRHHKLSDSQNSDYYEFVISSYSGSTWIQNCEGRVKPGEATLSHPLTYSLGRNVPVSRWYQVMERVGLIYGPEFQGFTKLSASLHEQFACADITNSKTRQNAPFLFHPATMDACFQVIFAARAQGIGRKLTQLCVPTMIEELDISKSGPSMRAMAWSTNDGRDFGIDCFADGETALRIRGLRMTPLEEDKVVAVSDRHAAARLEWYPDFDFIDISPLIVPPAVRSHEKLLLEELALLCIIESAEKLKGSHTDQAHFLKMQDWLQREIRRAGSGTYAIVKDAEKYVRFTDSQRHEMIKDRMERLSQDESVASVATGILRICENAKELFTGKVNTLDLLMQDNVLTEIYNVVSFGFADFVRMLSITKPNLRILEVGAGTGGTTELILRDIVNLGDNPAYSIYTYTDISAGFFPQARERFSYAPKMDYKVFDISKNPFDQGFKAESYDLILTPNVIHATPNLNVTLSNLRLLLQPQGHLVLSEACAIARALGYIFGHFSGWWLGEADDRKYEPYVSVDRWDRELKAAGFTGVRTSVLDTEEPYHYCAAIVTQPAMSGEADSQHAVVVLCDQPKEGICKRLIAELQQKGLSATIARLGESLPSSKNVISTLDLEGGFFENVTPDTLKAFQDLLRNRGQQKVLWLMPPTQVQCRDPRSAQSIGVLRTARAELEIPLFTLEISPSELEFSSLVMKIFDKVCSSADTEKLAPDKEYAVHEGIIKIGRYQPFMLRNELVAERSSDTACVKNLEIATPGLLDTLQWTEMAESKALPSDDHVEVETKSVGLNFRVSSQFEAIMH